MLLIMVLVREIESRRGQILNIFAKIKKTDQLLRAPSVGKHNSTRVDEGRKSLHCTNRSEQGGRACYVTPDLSYD